MLLNRYALECDAYCLTELSRGEAAAVMKTIVEVVQV